MTNIRDDAPGMDPVKSSTLDNDQSSQAVSTSDIAAVDPTHTARRQGHRRVTRVSLGKQSVALIGSILLLVVIAVSVLQPATQTQAAPLAPGFSLPNLAHTGQLSLTSLRGHAVLLNFFNSDCAPCLEELPTLRQLAAHYAKQGVVLVGVATFGDSAHAVTAMAKHAGLHYPMVLDQGSAVAQSFGVQGIPTTIFIEPHGRIKGIAVGPLTSDVIQRGIAATRTETCPCGPLNAIAAEIQQASAASQAPNGLSGDTVFTPGQWPAPQFSLHDENGQTITMASLRGRPTIITFTDAHCQEDCPVIGRALRQVVDKLGPDAKRVSIISVSVDPVGDTSAALRQFSATTGMAGHWHILRGSRAALSAVWRAYGIYVAPPASGSDIAHTAAIFIVDPHGNVRVLDSVPFKVDQVVANLRALLPH